MNKTLTGFALLAALAATGCQSAYRPTEAPEFEEYQRVVNTWTGWEKGGIYLKDRFLDLTDVVTADLSFGDGFLANVHATKFLQIGGGYMNHGTRWGTLKRAAGLFSDDRVEGGVAAGFNLYWIDIERIPLWGTSTLFEHEFAFEGPDYLSNRHRHWSDIGAYVHFAFLGANVNASPFEAVDFLLGILALPTIWHGPLPLSPEMDIGDDDTRARLREEFDLPHYEYTLEHWGDV